MKFKKLVNLKAITAVMAALIMAIVMLSGLFKVDNVSAEEVQPLADAESSLYGFTVDDENFDVVWSSTRFSVNYNGAYCGDVTLYLGGVTMKNQLSNGRYAQGVLVYAKMTPRAFELTDGSSTHEYRGRSRYLEITSNLGSGQTLLSATPENVAGSSSYRVGISASTSGSGSITANTTITQNALEIFNYSDSVQGTYNVKYQYNRHIWPWEWERTKYCWYESVQRAAFFFSTTSQLSSKVLTVKGTYAIDDGAIGMWNLEMGYEITTTSTVIVRF